MYEQFADVIKAFGSPVRLMILELLGQAEHSVDALAGASVGNTSAQLQILADAGLVVRRRDGNRIFYRLPTTRRSGNSSRS
jgi:DNA-binding transcriptional ArsR family regulator